MDDFDRFWEWANKPPRSRSAISTVRSWGHAANGITDFFAKVGNFGRVNTDELCIDDVCVTRDEFCG